MTRPNNITNRIRGLEQVNNNVPIDLYSINHNLDKLQDEIKIVLNNELIARNKINNIDNRVRELIETQRALKEKASLINKFLTQEHKRIKDRTEIYNKKTGFICKQVIKDIKEVIKMNERTLALSRDLIEQTNN
tara:strand:+ start:398 stop:799 length:402 start_codon:yes stop_codon:yes gene_type:complete